MLESKCRRSSHHSATSDNMIPSHGILSEVGNYKFRQSAKVWPPGPQNGISVPWHFVSGRNLEMSSIDERLASWPSEW